MIQKKRLNFLGRDLFKRTQKLEAKITAFLMNIIQAGVYYAQGIETYTREGCSAEYLNIRKTVSKLESENDSYRREIENDLYEHMLLPDMRSDILKLLEGCDKIINKYESNLLLMSVEKPQLIEAFSVNLLKMVQTNLDCVGALISGVKDFFAGQPDVGEYTLRTYHYEHLVDKQAYHLKEIVFEDKDLSLARQLQLKEFIYNIEKISDIAEDVADILKIMAVKHLI